MHIWIAWSVQMFVDICTSKKYPSMQEDMLDRYAAPLWLMKQIKLLNFICLTQRDASHSLKPPYYRCPRVSTTVLPRQPLRLQRWTWLKGKCGVCISVVYVVYIYMIYVLHCKITCKTISSLFSPHDLNLFFELWSKFTDSVCIVCTYEITRHWKKFESTYTNVKRIKGSQSTDEWPNVVSYTSHSHLMHINDHESLYRFTLMQPLHVQKHPCIYIHGKG